jgi:hypothetical protein
MAPARKFERDFAAVVRVKPPAASLGVPPGSMITYVFGATIRR